MSVVGLFILRTVVAFIIVLLASKFVGQPFKNLSGTAVAVMGIWLVSGSASVYLVLTVIVTWVLLHVGASVWALKSTPVRNFLNGKPTPLIQSGKVMEKNLRTSRMTIDDMMALLRSKNAFKMADVEFASLEPDGSVSVLLKSDKQPLTPNTQHVSVPLEGEPAVVIKDGQVQTDALANAGYDRAWLLQQITNLGAESWKDVFVAEVDGAGKVYVDLYDDLIDKPTNTPNPKPQVLATLKKLQADYEIYSLETKNQEAKREYEHGAQVLRDIVKSLTLHLSK